MEDMIKALTILLKYNKDSYPFGAEHDVFYFYINPSLVSEKDRNILDKEYGVYADENNESFYMFT